jgi:hypothetical protein
MYPTKVSRRDLLQSTAAIAGVASLPFSFAAAAPPPPDAPATEYFTHFGALSKLSVQVAQAMPQEKYGFKPHPDSMTFGELMSHIASTNYQFGAGLKDSPTPALPSPTDRKSVV